MASAKGTQKTQGTSQQELLILAHVAELDLLKQVYEERLADFNAECVKELAAISRKRRTALARILAQFELNRSASIARFLSNRERLAKGELDLSCILVAKA